MLGYGSNEIRSHAGIFSAQRLWLYNRLTIDEIKEKRRHRYENEMRRQAPHLMLGVPGSTASSHSGENRARTLDNNSPKGPARRRRSPIPVSGDSERRRSQQPTLPPSPLQHRQYLRSHSPPRTPGGPQRPESGRIVSHLPYNKINEPDRILTERGKYMQQLARQEQMLKSVRSNTRTRPV